MGAVSGGHCCCESDRAVDAKIVDVEIVQRHRKVTLEERVETNEVDNESTAGLPSIVSSKGNDDPLDADAKAARRRQYGIGVFLRQCAKGRKIVILKPTTKEGKAVVERKDGTLIIDTSIPAMSILTGGKVALQRLVAAVEDVYTIDDGARCIPTVVTEALSAEEANSIVRLVFKADQPGVRSPSSSIPFRPQVSNASSTVDARPSLASSNSLSPCSNTRSEAAGRSVIILEESRETRDRLLESLKFVVVSIASSSSPKRRAEPFSGSMSSLRSSSSSIRATTSAAVREDRQQPIPETPEDGEKA